MSLESPVDRNSLSEEENSISVLRSDEKNAFVAAEISLVLSSMGEDSMSVVCSVGGSLEWVVSSCVENTSVVDESSVVLL